MRLIAPPIRTAPDALDAELREMSTAVGRGMPRFPPPPPPVSSRDLGRIDAGRLARVQPLDPIQLAARVLLWIVAAVLVLSVWLIWRSV